MTGSRTWALGMFPMLIASAVLAGFTGLPAGAAPSAELEAAPPLLGPEGQAAYRDFLASGHHRAFAIAPGGAWAWVADIPDPQVAESGAIRTCSGFTDQRCTIYAADDQIVLDRHAWAASWGPYADADEAAARPTGMRRAMRFPDLRLAAPGGAPMKLSELRGRIVVLHFWGSWCAPCQVELREMQGLYDTLADDPRIVFVLVQAREDIERSRRWARRRDITMPLYDSRMAGPADHTFLLADGTGLDDRVLAPRFPATYVLDGNGVVLFSHLGPVAQWPAYGLFLRHAAGHMRRPARTTAVSPASPGR